MSQISRKNLSAVTSGRMWRSLDELADTPQFREMVEREFPDAASEWTDGASRRSFLKLMGASLALAGVAGGCSRLPEEKIVPYVRQPEQLIPGRPLFFASVTTHGGYARGILVESHEGRPTKIEGNPDHPASLGATDIWGQASILNLYDPDRLQTVMRAGEVSDWNNFINVLTSDLAKAKPTGGKGVRILSGTITSPTLASQIAEFRKLYPEAKWHRYEPIGRDHSREGARLATGHHADPIYHFDKAKVVVSLDDNFLTEHAGSVRYAREFIDGRRVRKARSKPEEMNRLYVAESTPTIVGAMADQRIRVKPSRMEPIARQIAAAVAGNTSADHLPADQQDEARWIATLVKDITAHRGESLIVVGESQPASVHALAHALNAALGNIGKTVSYIEPVEVDPVNHLESLTQLVADLNAGEVQTLIIIGCNPAYDAPVDLDVAGALKKFSNNEENFSVHLSSHNDETSFVCQWQLPLAHELESWGDARAFDGTASIIQPLIAPLYQGRSPVELMAIMLGKLDISGHEIVRTYWAGQHQSGKKQPTQQEDTEFASWWEKCLRDGVILGTASKSLEVKIAAPPAPKSASTNPAPGMEIVFKADPSLWDGSYANNGWLQEVPKPLTKITWDNVALMSAATAKKIGVTDTLDQAGNKLDTSIVRLTLNGRSVDAPAWIIPGQPDDVIAVHLGHGRTRAGRVGNGAGFNAYTLRTSDGLWMNLGLQVGLTSDSTVIACTENHSMMKSQYDRDILRIAPIGDYSSTVTGDQAITTPGSEANPEVQKRLALSLYPPVNYKTHDGSDDLKNKWGMVIDSNACIGCNACVIACQSENNIPVVGKQQVSVGREMLWLRIDAYYNGAPEQPEGPYFQPLPCMHCEDAPCEVVCPVEATVHDAEGLNNMVYNRCVGTRYCSNNCPYKVRHFNFLYYTESIAGSPLAMMMNPNVTVRYRGVMEKCSYCVQRISAARIDAKREAVNGQRKSDLLLDGEVVTACAQACPTQAIFFGNLNDADAKVTKLAQEPTNYSLLDEMQTLPRTTYLPRYTNPATKEG